MEKIEYIYPLKYSKLYESTIEITYQNILPLVLLAALISVYLKHKTHLKWLKLFRNLQTVMVKVSGLFNLHYLLKSVSWYVYLQ